MTRENARLYYLPRRSKANISIRISGHGYLPWQLREYTAYPAVVKFPFPFESVELNNDRGRCKSILRTPP